MPISNTFVEYLLLVIVRENVCNKAKNVKSHVFWDFEKKTLKNVKVMICKVLETTQSVFVL